MSSIVDTKELKFNKEFKAFAKDMGIDINKRKVNHPFTKGKVEVRNKFIKWIILDLCQVFKHIFSRFFYSTIFKFIPIPLLVMGPQQSFIT